MVYDNDSLKMPKMPRNDESVVNLPCRKLQCTLVSSSQVLIGQNQYLLAYISTQVQALVAMATGVHTGATVLAASRWVLGGV